MRRGPPGSQILRRADALEHARRDHGLHVGPTLAEDEHAEAEEVARLVEAGAEGLVPLPRLGG